MDFGLDALEQQMNLDLFTIWPSDGVPSSYMTDSICDWGWLHVKYIPGGC